ncbi:MAG: hypothetical protein PHZ09_07955 [Eubacteriales bacterium]|nr:hypothetical protein [Eubacteriales bacterium]
MQHDLNTYGKSVIEYGAKGDGINNDAPAFQAAFDSDCPLITIPFGKYIIGSPLTIGSDTAIHAHRRAEIILGDNVCTKRGDFLITNRNHASGNRNITIRGGIWNGSSVTNPKSDLFDLNGYSGALMNFINVINITISDVTLFNPSAYFTRFCKIDGFLFENITFTATRPCSNNDGIHLGGYCQNGIIRNLRASTPNTPNDDMVAMNADDCVKRAENLDLECGFIQNIVIDGLYADSCHSFIRMLSVDSEIKNISINNIKGGFAAMAINMDAARYCRTPLTDEIDVGCIKNVLVTNMDVYSTSKNSRRAFICLESNMENFVINNFKRDTGNDASDSGDTVRIRNIGESDIVLNGLTLCQIESFEGVRQSTPDNTEKYRFRIKNKTGATLSLQHGAFERLEINKTDNFSYFE